MKSLPTLTLIAATVFFWVFCPVRLEGATPVARGHSVLFDEWFDSFGRISWTDTKARMDGFAYFLERYPNNVGYIVVFWKTNADRRRGLRLAKHCKAYAASRIPGKSDIVIVDGGKGSRYQIVLEPVPKGVPQPNFKAR